ncbi:MAG: Smr/MutS family protein [Desulfobulbus sp.]
MPLVRQALDRLDNELRLCAGLGCRALTLIHGYGSSGAGGAIREAVRQQLLFWQQQGRIRAYIPGEQFEGRSRRGRQLLRAYPFLADHHDLDRANPGITVVLL